MKEIKGQLITHRSCYSHYVTRSLVNKIDLFTTQHDISFLYDPLQCTGIAETHAESTTWPMFVPEDNTNSELAAVETDNKPQALVLFREQLV